MSRSSDADDDRSLVERATHDLLNPISSILGVGETLRTRGASLGDETIRSFGESVVRQATRLEASIRDLGLANRLSRGDVSPALEPVSLEGIVAEVSGSDRVRVDVTPGATIRADPALLGGALRRLVENALEFSTGEVVVRAGNDGPGWLEVADRGTGFDERGLARAFEPLAPGSNVRNERGSGVGLGLFIARRLVECQGARLTVRSTPGEGSVFRIEFAG